MPIMETPTENATMTDAHAMLAAAIRSYDPAKLDENTLDSLRYMQYHSTFAPIRDVITAKIEEIKAFFVKRAENSVTTNLQGKPVDMPKNTPKRDTRKKRKATSGPEGSTPGPTMEFTVRGGILVPKGK